MRSRRQQAEGSETVGESFEGQQDAAAALSGVDAIARMGAHLDDRDPPQGMAGQPVAAGFEVAAEQAAGEPGG